VRLLLDTHIALWAVSEPERLTKRTQAQISDPNNEVAVSSITLWEIAIKRSVSRNRPDTPQLSPRDAKFAFEEAEFDLLSISVGHLEAVESLPFHNRDPFDRLLVATAQADCYTLLTHDKILTAYGDFVMLV
jgi:PIN domain nuclease of toxin-antitoxin system